MPPTPEQAGKQILFISADGFEDSELLQPYQQLGKEGMRVDIASLHTGTIIGKRGNKVAVHMTVDEVVPEQYDMLVLPGGKAPSALRKDQRVLDIARHFFRENKPVAAICHGPQVLISAGVMQGRSATAYHSVANEMKEAGVKYLDREVVVDGNLITSRQPDDIPAFIRQILLHLS